MTAKQAQTIEQALARAAKENIHIVGHGTLKADGMPFWIVSAKGYEISGKAYIVKLVGSSLVCNCRAQGICKHRSICHVALKEERAVPYPGLRAEALAAEQAEAERLLGLPREMASVETSEERKLEALDVQVTASRIADMERSLAWDKAPEAQEHRNEEYPGITRDDTSVITTCTICGEETTLIDEDDGEAYCSEHYGEMRKATYAARRDTALLVSSRDEDFSVWKA